MDFDVGQRVCDTIFDDIVEVMAIFDYLSPTVYKVKDEGGREYMLSQDDMEVVN